MRQKLLIKFCIWHWLLIKSTCLTSSHKNKCIFAQKSINVECFFYWIAKNGIIVCKIFNQLKQNQPMAFCTFCFAKGSKKCGKSFDLIGFAKGFEQIQRRFFSNHFKIHYSLPFHKLQILTFQRSHYWVKRQTWKTENSCQIFSTEKILRIIHYKVRAETIEALRSHGMVKKVRDP